jgi:cytolysin-activating lysine-acyltransferase
MPCRMWIFFQRSAASILWLGHHRFIQRHIIGVNVMLESAANTSGPEKDAAVPGSLPHDLPHSKRVAVNQPMALAQIVTLMLQSANHRQVSLSDLEWMVLPPLMLGQIAMAETRPSESGWRQPITVMFWASVSKEVDQRICANLSAPIRLRPDEWRSGDILWIADMIGDMSTAHALIKNLLSTALAGRKVRVRSLNSDGMPILLEVDANSYSVMATQTSATCEKSRPCPTGTLCASCITTGCTGRCRKSNGSGAVSGNH